ncbi:hypothetical protein I6J20_09490 [Corynebacterium glucuronolyticum]|uniref:hypothetical protein n=1 Tax=Corynebacterium glucuronolyticum TaxID=39791 RepID=UPI00019C19F5|nr:hypothetical protein [Corynebacterium glucuronolyticum]EEI27840.1 hypothetical protein HMPREF0294_0696 [Corynebacterium glucuronolyticum ATCC 51867]QRO82092.1 hypothetical protein I6J20_09490 [Corynebacterium glucuronolyticum]
MKGASVGPYAVVLQGLHENGSAGTVEKLIVGEFSLTPQASFPMKCVSGPWLLAPGP